MFWLRIFQRKCICQPGMVVGELLLRNCLSNSGYLLVTHEKYLKDGFIRADHVFVSFGRWVRKVKSNFSLSQDKNKN